MPLTTTRRHATTLHMADCMSAIGEREAIGQLHAFSKLLYARLLEIEVGQNINYTELNAIIGMDVQNGARHYLSRARKMALRLDRRVFDVIIGIGLKRVDGAETVNVSETHVAKIRRAAKRGLDTLATVDLTKLEREDVTRAHVTRAQLGITRVFTGNKTHRELSAAVDGKTNLPSARSVATKTLKMFGGSE